MEKPVFYPEGASTFNVVHRRDYCNTQIPPHIHDGIELYLSLSPLPNVLLGNKVLTAEPGTLVLIPPFCVHRLFDKTDELYDRYILSINASWLNRIIPQGDTCYAYLQDSGHPLLLFPPAPTMHAMQENLERLLSLHDHSFFELAACFLEYMSSVDTLVQHNSGNQTRVYISTTQRTVADIIRYLDEHIGENVSLLDLSEHFYLHPDYISRIFKKHTNTTVGSYITLRKTALAQQLLSEGYTVTQAQLMTGYSSYAHFARTFKQQTGIPPGAYRNRGIQRRLSSDSPAVPPAAASPP